MKARKRLLASRAKVTLALCATLTACDHTQAVMAGPVAIGPTHTRFTFGSVIHATGPTRELCLVVLQRDVGRLTFYGAQRTLRTPIRAVLLTVAGQRDSLDASVEVRSADVVCLWDHGLGNPWNAAHIRVSADGNTISPPAEPRPPLSREYAAVELWSDVPVQVREIRWWSGQRAGFP